ncbi:MAG: hypothetical protein CL846_01865 [Crocinitomicaceae bacterium]|nr:hypothetical protein [Crocinitomicaceae bacterium]
MSFSKKIKFRLAFRLIWISSILFTLIHYFIFPEKYTAIHLTNLLDNNRNLVFIVYLIISLIRSIFFLPSTIFVIMGIALYPNNPQLVLTISMLGIILGACWIYFSAGILKIEEVFSKKVQNKIQKTEISMNKYGLWIVLFWSFFPAVPTDLISYIAGYSKMNFLKFISALFIGELILVSIYIWTGMGLLELIFK